MYIRRIVVRNFRNFKHLDVRLQKGVTCIAGENNTGKSNLLFATRLAVDAHLSSKYRTLREHDIHSGADLSCAGQVLVSIEFTDYKDAANECALLGFCEVGENAARIHYRFRPRREILEKIEAELHDGTNLSLTEDYHYEMTGGGENDPANVGWNEHLGSNLAFGHLQSFHVEFLPALRDVQHSLRQTYESPLGRILSASEIGDEEKNKMVEILKKANAAIESQPTISKTGKAIKKSFARAAGPAFKMNLQLGMSDPSFPSISRSLKILLSNKALKDFEPARNGLGLNNILFISMLLEYFEQRAKSQKAAGHLLLIEEPEAHLHPQLQRVLYDTLGATTFQTILTTHSTHISSHAPVESFITLTNDGTTATKTVVPKHAAKLSDRESADLNRYLDATRSTLLFARKVMLIEGPAELFLIPVLVKQVLGLDLDGHGITLVPIYGKHFQVYAKLFGPKAIRKKCVVICDGDRKLEELGDLDDGDPVEDYAMDLEENDFLQVYECPVTFERAIVQPGTLPMLLEAVNECRFHDAAKELQKGIGFLRTRKPGKNKKSQLMQILRDIVLKSAIRCGKARFAQIASKHAAKATEVPAYIRGAVEWLIDD